MDENVIQISHGNVQASNPEEKLTILIDKPFLRTLKGRQVVSKSALDYDHDRLKL